MKGNAPSRSLPQFNGPKLAPFVFQNPAEPRIEFLNLLGTGLHSKVHRVRIDGKIYAAKVFCFWQIAELVPPHYITEEGANIQHLIYEFDPFYAECRTYGRLKETGNEDLTPKCYGWANIPYEQELKLDPYGEVFHRSSFHKPRTNPLRAIIKEVVSKDCLPFTFKMIPQMKRDLTRLSKIGIAVHDLRAGNYINGKIIDFSQARTSPHRYLNLNGDDSDYFVTETCATDFQAFDDMIKLWMQENPGQQVWDRFMPNRSFGRRLRNHARYDKYFVHSDCVKLDAALYDWKAAEKKRKKLAASKGTTVGQQKPASGAVQKKTRRKARR